MVRAGDWRVLYKRLRLRALDMHRLLRIPTQFGAGLPSLDRHSNGPAYCILGTLLGLGQLVLLIITCVALADSSSNGVVTACGPNLWGVILADLLVFFVGTWLGFCCSLLCGGHLVGPAVYSFFFFLGSICLSALTIVWSQSALGDHTVSTGLNVTHTAVANGCADAMAGASLNLGYIGYLYGTLFALLAATYGVLALCFGCAVCHGQR